MSTGWPAIVFSNLSGQGFGALVTVGVQALVRRRSAAHSTAAAAEARRQALLEEQFSKIHSELEHARVERQGFAVSLGELQGAVFERRRRGDHEDGDG